MNQTSSWRPPPTSPSLPPPVWQRQAPSLSVRTQNDLERVMSEPQAQPETHTQKLVASLDPAKIQEVAASQVVISDIYYKNVLQHSKRLFRWALIAAGTGLIFFLVAVALLLFRESITGALICLASGGVMQAVAMVNFYLYGRAFNQLRGFHERLDRTQQYLLANSICENLKGDVKQATQIELIRGMMRSLARQEEKLEKNTVK
jgi:uncharacterized membrane protein